MARKKKEQSEQLKELLKKLQTLAERGVGGEKTTAKKKLDKLLAANGMTEADLDEDKVSYYLFSYGGTAHKKKLLGQIMYKVVGNEGFAIYHSRGTRNKLGTYCTAAQKLEIELDFEFYSALLEEEIDILLEAFISKQDIYPKDSPIDMRDRHELTAEEIEKYQKRAAYASNMSKRKRSSGLIEDQKGKK